MANLVPWIEATTKPGDLVCDPYCGGGTVPLACLAVKRRWIATEINAGNASVARQRVRDAFSVKDKATAVA